MGMNLTDLISVGARLCANRKVTIYIYIIYMYIYMYKFAQKSRHNSHRWSEAEPCNTAYTYTAPLHDTKPFDMPETLLSILCSEPWRWDSFASSEITFNQDGTGKVITVLSLLLFFLLSLSF